MSTPARTAQEALARTASTLYNPGQDPYNTLDAWHQAQEAERVLATWVADAAAWRGL